MKASKLEKIYQRCLDADSHFRHKSVLFIPTESYDAPAVTIIEGLDDLGWNIYTYQKPNINSWFCNQVVENIPNIDFVLSNLHWGTRWSLYKELDLWDYPLVLIDGHDAGWLTWKQKHVNCSNRYKDKPPHDVVMQDQQPYRWVEPLHGYKPDVLFSSQSDRGHYLPFGMHHGYMVDSEFVWDKNEAKFDFTAVKGPGPKRVNLYNHIREHGLPGGYFNDHMYGEWFSDEYIEPYIQLDNNIHSWHRWRIFPDYVALMLGSFALIYPGVRQNNQWDAKRPWEALGAGCLLITEEPSYDTSEYPWTELCLTYKSLDELQETCEHVLQYKDVYDGMRMQSAQRARKYMAPDAMARYFLQCIYDDFNDEPDF